MTSITSSPPRAPPIKYTAPLGTRWAKEKAAAGDSNPFDLPTDPTHIGPWILGECVGKGASGRVKIAKHTLTGQLAAVKILPLAPLINSRASLATQQAKTDKQRLGIDREITMMKLMNHPNIMRIYDVFEGEKELFLVLEYVEGGELFDFLVNKGRLRPLEALAYFKQIIYGLNYAHTFSIIHRDLKPENILIHTLDPPLIKIADWGMAAFAPPSLQLETSCGSPHYASPEIVNGEKYEGNATDIWSCGVILFALLTGRLPFDDKNVRTLLAKVKMGKYETPAWVDPLAKDLLGKMLVVDVRKRITIPEILAHPWLLTPLSPTSPTSHFSHSLVTPTPPLPPSPSTLALPLPSPSHIDAELLESLRVIYGRHADPAGACIVRDLCSPVGEGTLAKAFYFLLGKYREGVRAERCGGGNTPGSDEFGFDWECELAFGGQNGKDGGKRVTKQYVKLGSTSGRQGSKRLEVRSDRVAPAPPSVHTPTRTSPAPAPRPTSTHTPARGRTQDISGLAPPLMSRTATGTSTNSRSRERPASPAGPRAPVSTKSNHGPSRLSLAPRSHSTEPPTSRPTPGINVGGMGKGALGPRPAPPRRGYTYSHSPQHDGRSSVLFPPVRAEGPQEAQLQVHAYSHEHERPKSASGWTPDRPTSAFKFSFGLNADLGVNGGRWGDGKSIHVPPSSTSSVVPAFTALGNPTSTDGTATACPVVHAPVPILPAAPILPLLTAPRTLNAELQRTMDDITDRVNGLVARGNMGTAAHHDVAAASAPAPSHRTSLVIGSARGHSKQVHQVLSRAQEQGEELDKENRNVGEEGSSCADVHDEEKEKERGLGLSVVEIGREIATIPLADGNKGRNGRTKGRPPMLDLPSLNRKMSTLSVLGSPVLLSAPSGSNNNGSHLLNDTYSNTNPNVSANRRLTSPVVEEFKGWFSNLFNWKIPHAGVHPSSRTGILYSPDEVIKTRREVGKLLEGLGIIVEGNGFSSSSTVETDGVLRCRAEEARVDALTSITLKPVRFRVEFSSALQQHNTSLLSPHSSQATPKTRTSIMMSKTPPITPAPAFSANPTSAFPLGCASAIILIQEKGSVSTFKTVWRRLKEVYCTESQSAADGYPSLSPAMGSTPLLEPAQRFAV